MCIRDRSQGISCKKVAQFMHPPARAMPKPTRPQTSNLHGLTIDHVVARCFGDWQSRLTCSIDVLARLTCSIDTFRACLSAQLTFKLISNATPAGRTPLAPRPIRIRSSHARRPTRAAPRPKFAPMHDVAEADHGERLTKGARIPSALSTSLLTSPAIPCLTRKGAALPSGNKAPTAPPLTAREPIRIAFPRVSYLRHACAVFKKKKCGGSPG